MGRKNVPSKTSKSAANQFNDTSVMCAGGKIILRSTALKTRTWRIVMGRSPLLGDIGCYDGISKSRRIVIVVPVIGIPFEGWQCTSKDDEKAHEEYNGEEKIQGDVPTTKKIAQV